MNDNQSGIFWLDCIWHGHAPSSASGHAHCMQFTAVDCVTKGFSSGNFPIWFCLFPFRFQNFCCLLSGALWNCAGISYKAYLAHPAFPEYLNHLHLHVLSLCQSGSSSRQAVSSLFPLSTLSLRICIRICCENKFRRKPFVLFICSNIYGKECVCVCECIYYVC